MPPHSRASIGGPRRGLAKPPLVLALAGVIRDLPGAFVHATKIAERLERGALDRAQVALEDVHRRSDVRIGVEDLKAVPRQGNPPIGRAVEDASARLPARIRPTRSGVKRRPSLTLLAAAARLSACTRRVS